VCVKWVRRLRSAAGGQPKQAKDRKVLQEHALKLVNARA
jgi:hypothetical protein